MRVLVSVMAASVLVCGIAGCAGTPETPTPVFSVARPPVLPQPPQRGGVVDAPEWLLVRIGQGDKEGVPTDLVRVSVDEPIYALPYQPVRIMSPFDDVRGRGRLHRAIDFAGVGPDLGLGTPIFAIGRSRIERLGSGEVDPFNFGRPLRGSGTVRRGGHRLPRSLEIPEYGRVYFFTRNYGRWRSGTIIITEMLEGPLAGHTVRYMHLGAIHPDLEVGDIVERGQEIGLMGGTAVQSAGPHLHIDAEDSEDTRIDLTPYFGLDGDETGEEEVEGPDC